VADNLVHSFSQANDAKRLTRGADFCESTPETIEKGDPGSALKLPEEH
jgi:hypothetical protein